MWIEGLSTGDNESYFVQRALVLVLCYEMLLLSHFSISEVLSSLSTSAWGVGASTVSHLSEELQLVPFLLLILLTDLDSLSMH